MSAGKGSKPRPIKDLQQWGRNYDFIFRKPLTKSPHSDIIVTSSENNPIRKDKNMSEVASRKGSGRTKGAVSLVSVKLSDLMARFKPDDLVVVGRVFVNKAGVPVHGPAISLPASAAVQAGVTVTIPAGTPIAAPAESAPVDSVTPVTETVDAPAPAAEVAAPVVETV